VSLHILVIIVVVVVVFIIIVTVIVMYVIRYIRRCSSRSRFAQQIFKEQCTDVVADGVMNSRDCVSAANQR
jgi:uncharacterized membrane protein YcaP (DUF421 family)